MPATRELVGAHAWMREHVEAGVEARVPQFVGRRGV
jgi:hypothetical protein